MNENKQGLKYCSVVALLSLLLLLLGAIFYYRERALFSDAAYIAFNTVNNGKFYIQELRFGSFITQGVPLIMGKLHFSIQAILLAYSASFNLFFLFIAVLLVVMRRFDFAVLMGLYYFLFVSASYFWTNNEIHQAVAWMFLFFGTTIYLGNKKVSFPLQLIAFIPLASITVFTHFLVTVPCTFLWVYLVLGKANWPFSRKQTIILSTVLAILVLVKFILSIMQPYDGSHLQDPTHATLRDLLSTFSNPLVTGFLKGCITNYWITTLVYATSIIALIQTRKFKLLSWVLACTLAYIVAMKLTFGGYKDVPLFYIESEWASLAIVVASPFVFSFLPRIKPYKAVLVLVLVIAVRLAYILNAAPEFEERTRFKERILAQMEKKNITKLALADSSLNEKYPGAWSLPDETILLSALRGDKPQKVFLLAGTDIEGQLRDAGNRDMIDCYWHISPAHMHVFYFSVDTTKPYEIMTTGELFK